MTAFDKEKNRFVPTSMIRIKTVDHEETKGLGRKIGALLSMNTVFALTGDPGSGKTTFVQGLAQGLEVDPSYYVTSPSFTLINEYPGRLPLYHIDLYRLSHIEEFEEIGLHDILTGRGVIAVEWAERLPKTLLNECISVYFTIDHFSSRMILVQSYGENENNLIWKLKKHVEGENGWH